MFEAVAVHRDEIATLPPGGIVSPRTKSGLQAAEIRHGRGVFWGVQYHPEYDYNEIAAVGTRYGDVLVNEGLFRDRADLDAWAAELRTLQACAGRCAPRLAPWARPRHA